LHHRNAGPRQYYTVYTSVHPSIGDCPGKAMLAIRLGTFTNSEELAFLG
jgi:hypothetical protein